MRNLLRCPGSVRAIQAASHTALLVEKLETWFFDLFIEELVEGGNQFFRWTLLYDGADFVSETD